MSFAVIQTGGKQYKVKAGEIIKVEKLLDSKAESKVEFKEANICSYVPSNILPQPSENSVSPVKATLSFAK